MPGVVVTEPYKDYRQGARAAVIVKEVSGVNSGLAAKNACGISQGSQFRDDSRLTCDNWDAQQVSIDFYRVTFSFSPNGSGLDNSQLVLLPEITWDIGLNTEPSDEDPDGNPIVNSAGDPFSPPPLFDQPVIYLNVRRYEPAPFNVKRMLKFVGKVNKGPMTVQGFGLDDGQMLCRKIAPGGAYTRADAVIPVDYNFELRGEGFDIRILDQGLRGWRIVGGKPKKGEIFGYEEDDPDPKQISAPVLLNGRGKPIIDHVARDNGALVENPAGGPPKGSTVDGDKTKAIFLVYKRHVRISFTELGL